MLRNPIFLEVGNLCVAWQKSVSSSQSKCKEKEEKEKKKPHPSTRTIPLEDGVLSSALAVGDAAALGGEGVDDVVAVEAGPEAVARVPAPPPLRPVRRHCSLPYFLLPPLLGRRAE